MWKLCFATALLLICSLIPGCRQAKPKHESSPLAPTAEEIISKHLEATGGAARLRAIQTVRLVRASAAPGIGEGETVVLMKRGDKYLQQTSLSNGSVTRNWGCDGKSYWPSQPSRKTNSMFGVSTNDPEYCKELSDVDGVLDGVLVDYERKGFTVEFAGIRKIADGDAYDLKVKKAGNGIRATHFYIDVRSFLLAGVARETGGTHVEDRYSDYRKVDGIMMAFTWETRWWDVHDDPAPEENAFAAKIVGTEGSYKQVVKEISFNVPLPDSLFAGPPSESATESTRKPRL